MTAPKEHPILFSGAMVRAILDGRKTQTRRVVKPQPDEVFERSGDVLLAWGEEARSVSVQCPYGAPGDLLWVRETHAYIWPAPVDNGMVYDDEHPEGRPIRRDECEVEYRADTGNAYPGDWPPEDARGNSEAPKWSPSIFMPRWASRLTLRVTDVRVERLQSISEADAEAEGAEPILVPPDGGSCPFCEGFRRLWDSINAKRGHGWDTNPWVWVVSFERVES